ncbi:MAG: ATP-binding protein [Spirochaetaceae bacterium]|nr:ATP-binding protein [Spirochaetaceae bacterium]
MVSQSLRAKIIIPIAIIMIFLVAVMIVYSSTRFLRYTEDRISSHIIATTKGLNNHLDNSKLISRAAAVSTALRPDVISAVEQRDIKAIIEAVTPLKFLYGIDYYTIADAEGSVLARTHAPEIYGDSVLGLRIVTDALAGNTSTYFEECSEVKVSVRTGAPIYNANGRLIGVVSAGVRLDTNEAVDRLKEQFDTEITVFYGDTRIATTIKMQGERILGTRLYQDIFEVVKDGKEFFGRSDVLGERFLTYYLPLFNADNEVFAILFAGSSKEAIIGETSNVILSSILLGLVGLVISILVLLFLVTKITRPVKDLLVLVSDVKEGDINNVPSDVRVAKDEIGELIVDVYALIGIIKSILGDISHMTRELHNTGDIEFQIDTSKYKGLYKEIIGDIQDLGDSISRMNKTMAVMDYLKSMVVVADFDYNLLYANRSVADTYKIDIENSLGQKCYKAIKNLNEPCSFCPMQQLAQSKEAYPIGEYTYNWDECSGKWLGGQAAVIRWTDGSRVFCMINNDETKIKQYEEQLKVAVEQSKAMSIAKSSFLANMSHEIRTPMNAIIGMSELLKQEKLTRRQIGFTNDIYESAHSLLSIINDILDFSKIESGKLELNPVDYDFKALIDNVISMFSYVAHKKGLDFKFDSEGEIPHYLFGDDIRLRQVLTNICGNAVKFTDSGHIRLKVVVLPNKLLFEIKDTGRGIREEDAPKLFSAFQQADTSKNRKAAGTGLGLVISKTFVEMMGGSISFASEYGQGTVFTILVPLVTGDKTRVLIEKENKETLSMVAPTASVLVVDDNEFNLRVATGLLSLFKIKVDVAESGMKGIELIQQNEYDIVFMDHMMPELDGIETTAAIRKLGYQFTKIPIIALTANAVQGAKEMFLANGFSDFVSKPIEIQKLSVMLSTWLPPEKINNIEVSEKGYEEPDTGADANKEKDFLSALNMINEINTKIGISRVSGMEDIYRDSVVLFTKKVTSECNRMSSFIKCGDIDSFAIRVHAMKSMLSTIGAMALSERAAMLELAAKNRDLEYCLKQYPDYHADLLSLHRRLSDVFPDEEKMPNKKKGNITYLNDQLSKAIATAEDLDNEACIKVLKDLFAYDFGDSVNADLQRAMAAVEKFDYDKAGEVLQQIANL